MILQFENFHLVPIYWHRTIKGYVAVSTVACILEYQSVGVWLQK